MKYLTILLAILLIGCSSSDSESNEIEETNNILSYRVDLNIIVNTSNVRTYLIVENQDKTKDTIINRLLNGYDFVTFKILDRNIESLRLVVNPNVEQQDTFDLSYKVTQYKENGQLIKEDININSNSNYSNLLLFFN